jgi:hypothetical protein
VTPPLSTSTPASHRGLTQAGGALAAPQADVRQLHAAPAALASALQHSAAKKVERLPSKSASGPCLCTQTCHTPIPTHTHTSTSPTYHNHTDIHPRNTTLTGAPPPPPSTHPQSLPACASACGRTASRWSRRRSGRRRGAARRRTTRRRWRGAVPARAAQAAPRAAAGEGENQAGHEGQHANGTGAVKPPPPP